MAHAIIFVDRAPLSKRDEYTAQYVSFSAGAYKVASVLRDMGLEVLVVPNCLNYTFKGIKQVIENNKSNLLWVGISSTFMSVEKGENDDLSQYREEWNNSKDLTLSMDPLMIKSDYTYDFELVWHPKDMAKFGHYLKIKYDVPLLIGGGWSKHYYHYLQNYKPFNQNIFCADDYAESFVKEFTEQKLKNAELPVLVSNTHYNDNDFKINPITWADTDFVEKHDWLTVEVARGCAFNCAYCSYPRRGRFDSFRDPDSLRTELIRNYEQFGVTTFFIVDDLYNDSKEKVRILHDKVWSKLPFRAEWSSSMRLDMLWADPDSAEIIRDSGCRFAQFGIETLHDVAGRRVGKGLGRDRTLKTLEHINKVWKNDVLISAGFIAGLPFEPIESIKETMEWSLNTDLLFNASWQPLVISPPSTVTDRNRIEEDFNKYQVEWIDKSNWKNSAGVTYKEVRQLVVDLANNRSSSTKFKVHIRNYIDLRTLGMTHERLADVYNNPITEEEIAKTQQLCSSRVNGRINKILNLKS